VGPFLLDDTFGMSVAIVTLQVSLNPGKYDKNGQFGMIQNVEVHTQMDTMLLQQLKMQW
jgi:hypothetical protein